MDKLSTIFLRLDLHDGGAGGSGAGAGTGGAEGGSTGETGVDAGLQTGGNGQVAAVSDPNADRESYFNAMIKGDYKDLYDKNVQNIVKGRLKSVQSQVDAYNALSPTLDLLYGKYGVEAGDVEALNQAIADDDTYYEQEALERGLTVSQLKDIKRIERENADLRRQMTEQETRENADRLYAQWMEQSEQIKQVYPSFNIDDEMQNPKFVDLLRSNIDLRTAYEVIHKDDIIAGAMQFAHNQATQKVVNAVAAGQARPIENGMSGMAAAVSTVDVAHMTKEQRDDIRRRVAMGERITL